ncbi:MAG: hypothetical protein N2745_12295 [Syntrophorhabdaceae bacterium]|nr:hypothetical protein [Syntrophorhabdaceae bacterium]
MKRSPSDSQEHVSVTGLQLKEKKGVFEITADVKSLGRDVIVMVYGGIAHIGAIGIAQPRQSLKDSKKVSATSSVYTFISHKEDIIVKAMSEKLASRLNRKVVVIAGIHWDDLKPEDISTIEEICGLITEKVVHGLKKKKG